MYTAIALHIMGIEYYKSIPIPQGTYYPLEYLKSVLQFKLSKVGYWIK